MDAVNLSGQKAICICDSAVFSSEHITERQIPNPENRKDELKKIGKYSLAHKPSALLYGSVKVVSFEEVIANFEKEHGSYGDTNHIARNYINRANKEIVIQSNGGWLFVELPYETAMKVLLPGHTHDGEIKTLLKECGLTAKDAAKSYGAWSERDKKNNPLCSGSLNYHLKTPNKKPIFLTVEPINDRYDYGKIIDNPELAEGRLVHLDGLHRLVALAIANQEDTIAAYIACKETLKKVDGLGLINGEGIQDN